MWSLRVALLSAIFSALALTANLVNLVFVTKSLYLANRQNARADYLVAEQLAASLPRFSVIKSSTKPDTYVVRNVGGQPAWGIGWALIQLGSNGFPSDGHIVDFNTPGPPNARVLQPGALNTRDEAEITITADKLAQYQGPQLEPGLMLMYETIDTQPQKTVFALREGGNYVVQTVAPSLMASGGRTNDPH